MHDKPVIGSDFDALLQQARDHLRLGDFGQALICAQRLRQLRPAALWPKIVCDVVAVACGDRPRFEMSDVTAGADHQRIVQIAMKAARRRRASAEERRLQSAMDDVLAGVLVPANIDSGADGVLPPVRLTGLSAPSVSAAHSADEPAHVVRATQTQVERALKSAKRAMRDNDIIEAARSIVVAGAQGDVEPTFVSRVHKQLLAAGYVDEAARFTKDAPGTNFDRMLLTLRQYVAEGQYESAVALARQPQATATQRLQLHRTAFLALRSQRRHAEALEFGLSCLDAVPVQNSTFGYSVARTASLCDTSPSNIARALAAAYRYADSVQGTAREAEDWPSLLKFRLLTFDFEATEALLDRLQSNGADELATARRQLVETKAEVAGLLAPIRAARDRLRQFADRHIETLDARIDTEARIQIHMPGGWLTHKPRQDRLRIDVRPTFFTIMGRLRQQRVAFELIPQLGANEHVVRPKPDMLSIAYHTICKHPNVINIKGSDLPNYLYFDRSGYAGWSELADRDELNLSDIDADEAQRFFESEQKRILEGNISKYPQAAIQDDEHLPDRYVFVALQTRIDKVQELAYVPMLTMLDWVVERFAGTGIKVVVKRHPDCADAMVAERLMTYSQRGNITISNASIHAVIEKCEAVFTVNSGVGCEALIHRKHVFLFGKSDYRFVCHSIKSRKELLSATWPLIHSGRQPQLDLDTLRRFIFWYRNRYLINATNVEQVINLIDSLAAQFRKPAAVSDEQCLPNVSRAL